MEKAVHVYFERPLTDDELRTLHELLAKKIAGWEGDYLELEAKCGHLAQALRELRKQCDHQYRLDKGEWARKGSVARAVKSYAMISACERADAILAKHLEAPALTIHVLRAGVAMCGLPGLPDTWPDSHRWVGTDQVAQATCPQCIAAAHARAYPS